MKIQSKIALNFDPIPQTDFWKLHFDLLMVQEKSGWTMGLVFTSIFKYLLKFELFMITRI